MLLVVSGYYYLAVQKNYKSWVLAWCFFGHQKIVEKIRNPNDSLNRR